MTRKTLAYTAFFFLFFGLFVSSFVSKQSRAETGTFLFQRTLPLGTKGKERTIAHIRNWMNGKFGPQNVGLFKNGAVGYGSFYVIARSFLGKTTKICHYTYTVKTNNDSLFCKVENVYFTWQKASMHKGDRGGEQYKALEDILPLEKKVPLEKRSYRQYVEQMEEHLETVFAQTERIVSDTVAGEQPLSYRF